MLLTKSKKEAITELIKQGKTLLQDRDEYCSKGNKAALADMIEQAEKALAGKKVPFVRKREFYAPREEEEIRFAISRYTMGPTYLYDKVYDYYGLKEAISWFKTIDILADGYEVLPEKADFIIKEAEEFLKKSKYGTTIGCVDKQLAEKLAENLTEVRNLRMQGEVNRLAKAIIKAADTKRNLRFSTILRTDIDKESSLFFTEADRKAIKDLVKTEDILKKQYMEVKGIAEQNSLPELKKVYSKLFIPDDYETLNNEFYLWSDVEKIANFSAPGEAKYATVSFLLPSLENETDGLGHVWIDNVKILSGTEKDLQIKNEGFEDGESLPDYWSPVSKTGNPILKWEDTAPFCGKDKRSIYICNPTNADMGAWNYNEKVTIKGGAGYTFTFCAKIDGKFKKGLIANISFLDGCGKKIGEFNYTFNRKSFINAGLYNLNMQCDSIMYAITDDKEYAFKTKYEMLYLLEDFCQGAEHWLVTNLRPEGSDAYGGVQGGRNLSVIACAYSLIKNADVFDKKEKEHFYDLVDYMLRYMLDLRDRTELSPVLAQRGCSNWQTDMCAGAALMMMVLEDFPKRKNWLYNAHVVLKAQLECNVNEDGSWPESIRYHHAALEHFAGYAKAVQHIMGENWFSDTYLGKMFGFSLHTQTPGYEYFNGKIATPPFGDHVLSDGREFAVYGVYLNEMETADKKTADKMYTTWCLAGKPMKQYWGESMMLDNFMVNTDSYKVEPDFKFSLESTAEYENAGIYIFRKNFAQKNQSYFAVMSSPKLIGHGHYDQGSFIIYKNSVPIVMDSGIEGYFDTSTQWHLCSYSHACLQFESKEQVKQQINQSINLTAGTYSRERGWLDVPRQSKVLEISLGGEIESITIEIKHPEKEGVHIRKISLIKACDLYIIEDTIRDYSGKILFNIPVASKNSTMKDNRILSDGFYDIDLETIFLSKVESVDIEKGRTTPFFPTNEEVPMMEYIRARSDAQEGFKVLLYPKEKKQTKLKVREDKEGNTIINGENGQEIVLSKLEGITLKN